MVTETAVNEYSSMRELGAAIIAHLHSVGKHRLTFIYFARNHQSRQARRMANLCRARREQHRSNGHSHDEYRDAHAPFVALA